eukprot:scaffold44988_cov67-Phaeocystis_antarctica.AAC.5
MIERCAPHARRGCTAPDSCCNEQEIQLPASTFEPASSPSSTTSPRTALPTGGTGRLGGMPGGRVPRVDAADGGARAGRSRPGARGPEAGGLYGYYTVSVEASVFPLEH